MIEYIAERFSKNFSVWGVPECELRGYVSHIIRQKYKGETKNYADDISEDHIIVLAFISGDCSPTKKILDSVGLKESIYYSPR